MFLQIDFQQQWYFNKILIFMKIICYGGYVAYLRPMCILKDTICILMFNLANKKYLLILMRNI